MNARQVGRFFAPASVAFISGDIDLTLSCAAGWPCRAVFLSAPCDRWHEPSRARVKVAGHGEGKAYIYVDDAEGLVSLIQMGSIELHAGGRRLMRSRHLIALSSILTPRRM